MNYLNKVPEIFLFSSTVIVMVYCLFYRYRSLKSFNLVMYFLNKMFHVAIGILIITTVFLLVNYIGTIQEVGNHKITQYYTLNFISKLTVLTCSILIILVSKDYLLTKWTFAREYVILILLVIFSLLIVLDTQDLLVLFVSLEMSAMLLSVLGMSSDYSTSHNLMALKYLLFNCFSALIIAYGISFIYGYVGSLQFSEISNYFNSPSIAHSSCILNFAVILVVLGIASKLPVLLLNIWFLEASRKFNYFLFFLISILFSFVFFVVILKLFWGPFIFYHNIWKYAVYIFSIASIFIGYGLALLQKNIMKIIAYCCIAKIGFISLVLVCGGSLIYPVLLTSSLVFIFGNLGIFSILMWSQLYYKKLSNISDLRGLIKTNAFYALLLTTFFLSLGELPPFSGFFAKLMLLFALFSTKQYLIGCLATLASTVGFFLYIKLARCIYLSPVFLTDDNDKSMIVKRYNSLFSLNISLLICFFVCTAGVVCLINFFNIYLIDLWPF